MENRHCTWYNGSNLNNERKIPIKTLKCILAVLLSVLLGVFSLLPVAAEEVENASVFIAEAMMDEILETEDEPPTLAEEQDILDAFYIMKQPKSVTVQSMYTLVIEVNVPEGFDENSVFFQWFIKNPASTSFNTKNSISSTSIYHVADSSVAAEFSAAWYNLTNYFTGDLNAGGAKADFMCRVGFHGFYNGTYVSKELESTVVTVTLRNTLWDQLKKDFLGTLSKMCGVLINDIFDFVGFSLTISAPETPDGFGWQLFVGGLFGLGLAIFAPFFLLYYVGAVAAAIPFVPIAFLVRVAKNGLADFFV